MSKDRLLSDEELGAEMYALAITFGDELMEKPRVRARVMQDIKTSVDLINTQKRLYAESVIGEDEDLNAPKGTYGKDDTENHSNPMFDPKHLYLVRRATRNSFRYEQRARIK